MKKALVVVSFGTSYADTREKTIGGTEDSLARAFPEYDLRRAFTSRIIMKKLHDRDGISVDSVCQVVEKLYLDGYQEVLIQPLHVIPGYEYEEVISDLVPYVGKFARFAVGAPLLAEDQDCHAVVQALSHEIADIPHDVAIVWMGHGSSHPANIAYRKLNDSFVKMGFPNMFVATVEGTPTIYSVMSLLEAQGIQKVTLIPFMLVAGDHAQNDMAGDGEESWKSILQNTGYTVATRLVGLGEIESIRAIYIEHARIALKNEDIWKTP